MADGMAVLGGLDAGALQAKQVATLSSARHQRCLPAACRTILVDHGSRVYVPGETQPLGPRRIYAETGRLGFGAPSGRHHHADKTPGAGAVYTVHLYPVFAKADCNVMQG